MKAMFPNNQSSGLSTGGRTLLVVGGAVIIAAALVLYRGELRSEVRSLMKGDDATPTVVVHPNPAARRGGTAPRKTAPKASAVAAQKPGQAQPAAAGVKPASGPAGAIGAAKNAAAAANARVAAQTGNPFDHAGPAAAPTAVQAGHPAAPASTPTPATSAPKVTVAGISAPQPVTGAAPTGAAARSTKDSAAAPTVMREVYSYDKDARRDPFYSLMTSGELRPSISDLKLMGILYDESGRRPVAIMRDAVTNAQYRVTNGQQLGRMRVAQIRRKMVLFTIEEFGMNRQDSLVLGDSTKARAR